MKNSKERLLHLLLEGLVIVFSVLAALLVEDWRSDRQATNEVESALAALDAEVAANLKELEEFLVVVGGRHDRMVAMAPEVDGSRPFSEYEATFGGYRLPDIDLSAWARVRSNPVANSLVPARMREAFILYRSLDFFVALDVQILQLTFSPGYHDPGEAELTFRIAEAILSQQIGFANNIVPQHRAFLEPRQ